MDPFSSRFQHKILYAFVIPFVSRPYLNTMKTGPRGDENRYVQLHLPSSLNLLKPTGHVKHQQFNIQQLYALPTLYLCVLYLSANKQRLVPLTA